MAWHGSRGYGSIDAMQNAAPSPTDIQLLEVRTTAQVAAVARMAREVWDEYYVPLIGQAQVDYMVAKFQTPAAMQAQTGAGYEYFQIQRAQAPHETIGYAAIRHDAPDARLF